MVNLEEVLPEVERIARTVARDYPDVDWRDVVQHLSVLLLEKKELYWGDGKMVSRVLKQSAKSYCNRERAIQLYGTSQYTYRPTDVCRILETAFRGNELTNTYVPLDAESIKNSADSLDMASDVRMCWELLGNEERKSIFMKYALGITPEHSSYERKKLNKAVNKLTRILNSYKPTPKRKVISNATANAIIDNGY